MQVCMDVYKCVGGVNEDEVFPLRCTRWSLWVRRSYIPLKCTRRRREANHVVGIWPTRQVEVGQRHHQLWPQRSCEMVKNSGFLNVWHLFLAYSGCPLLLPVVFHLVMDTTLMPHRHLPSFSSPNGTSGFTYPRMPLPVPQSNIYRHGARGIVVDEVDMKVEQPGRFAFGLGCQNTNFWTQWRRPSSWSFSGFTVRFWHKHKESQRHVQSSTT